MARYVFLDSNILSLAGTPASTAESAAFLAWAGDAPVRGTNLVGADINWFEVRRRLELLVLLNRPAAGKQLAQFDAFCTGLEHVRIIGEDWAKASELWSRVRQIVGGPTPALPIVADDGLDADVILAAVALNFEDQGHRVAIATNNLKDFDRFVPFGGVKPHPWRLVPL